MTAQHEINIIVDKQHVAAPKAVMTGTELRQLHKPPIGPERDLFLKVPGPGDDRKIGNSEQVELKDGMHFFSVPAQINPGAVSTISNAIVGERDAGLLLETDVSWLDEKGYSWSVTPDGAGGGYFVIKDYPLAPGRFDRDKTDLLLRITKGYNDSALDMWWVSPAVRLTANNGYPPAADQFEPHLGQTWQRFSRHLQSPWRAGIDDIPRYMILVARELQGAA